MCATFFFFRMCVRVCVITYAWLREGVKLDSKILYNTAYICHGRELPHELNRDKEQIYLKWLCYIPWTTVKLKKKSVQKKNLGHTYMKWYICICIMQRRNHDGHLTFYLLLSGFTVEIIRFPVFLSFWHPALCIYLYPVADPGDFQAIWDRGPRTIREINSKRIHLLNWWLLN